MAKDRTLKQKSYGGLEGAVTDFGYDSYATAWRYLGVFIDCSESGNSWSKWWGSGKSSSSSSSTKSCSGGTRKLLWAAYANPVYRGYQIGEYDFYVDGSWDSSTCTAKSCTRMDCHDMWQTSWELIGIYKETVDFGNDMFYEQLFKHQGYCLWDGDKESFDNNAEGEGNSHSRSHDYSNYDESTYQFMQAMRKELPSGCTQIKLTYGDADYYYVDIKPLSEGDVTLGIYEDSSCVVESKYTFEDYQAAYASSLTATGTSDAFDTFNSNMDVYKTCQPCRAYNRQEMYESGWYNQRRLTEYYDGQGDYEVNNYNCYDDAHYQNCNQCYKFETHSDMAVASKSDLKEADAQGTILLINYKGSWYGNGTVGDVEDLGAINTKSASYKNGYAAGYSAGWASRIESSRFYQMSASGDSMTYSAAGAASILLCGFGLVKAYKRATRRSVALASDEGSGTPQPLIELR